VAHLHRAEQLTAKCLELALSLPGFVSPVRCKKRGSGIGCARAVLLAGVQGPEAGSELGDKTVNGQGW